MVNKTEKDYIYNIKFYKTILAIILAILFLSIILLIPIYHYSAGVLIHSAIILQIIMMVIASGYTYYHYIDEVFSYRDYEQKKK